MRQVWDTCRHHIINSKRCTPYLCQFPYWLTMVGLYAMLSTPRTVVLCRLTMSHNMSNILRLYARPRESIRAYMYSGCNLWYFKLTPALSACTCHYQWGSPQIQDSCRSSYLKITRYIAILSADVANEVENRIEPLKYVRTSKNAKMQQDSLALDSQWYYFPNPGERWAARVR